MVAITAEENDMREASPPCAATMDRSKLAVGSIVRGPNSKHSHRSQTLG